MTRYIYIIGIFFLLLASCANRGQGPQGGPRDTISPVVLKEVPLNGTLLFTGKEVQVYFDEYIQLDDVLPMIFQHFVPIYTFYSSVKKVNLHSWTVSHFYFSHSSGLRMV